MKFSQYNLINTLDDNFLLVNTLTGAMFTIDEDLKKQIENGELESLSDDVVREYIKTGIIVDDFLMSIII